VNRPKVTAILITLNEEKNIRDCLESIKWVDEIIVIDSISNDRTVDICKEYTNRIYQRKYQGTSRTRNWGASLATHDWIMTVDADERWPEALHQEIIRKLSSNTTYTGYYFPVKTHFLNRAMTTKYWYPKYYIRLFNRNYGRFKEQEVHAPFILDGNAGYMQNDILHFPYPDIETYLEKLNRYTSWQAKDMLNENIPLSRWDFPYKSMLRLVSIPFRHIIFYKAYRDGLPGIVISFLLSFYYFVLFCKYWLLRTTSPKTNLQI